MTYTIQRSQLPSPTTAEETGGVGFYFEDHVATHFAVLVLVGGEAPFIEGDPHSVEWIRPNDPRPPEGLPNGRKRDFAFTDDLHVGCLNRLSEQKAKLLISSKKTFSFAPRRKDFRDFVLHATGDIEYGHAKPDDRFVLVTQSLTKVDSGGVPWLLERARIEEDPTEFDAALCEFDPSSKEPRQKFEAFQEVFKYHGLPAGTADIHGFLRRINIMVVGPTDPHGSFCTTSRTLLRQLRERDASLKDPDDAYNALIRHIADKKAHRLKYRREDLLEQIRRKPPGRQFYGLSLEPDADSLQAEAGRSPQQVGTVMLATFLGTWRDSDILPQQLLSEVGLSTRSEFDISVQTFRIREPNTIRYQPEHERWVVDSRLAALRSIRKYIFPRHLRVLGDFAYLAAQVGGCHSTEFRDLQERLGFPIKFEGNLSQDLRRALWDGIALIAAHAQELERLGNLSHVSSPCYQAVSKSLSGLSWMKLRALSPVLRSMAEVAPEQFLYSLENFLATERKRNSEEEKSVLQDNERHVVPELPRALEILAWSPELLPKAAALLAQLDDIGTWPVRTRSPLDSLVDIFLPWMDNTNASIDCRKQVLTALSIQTPHAAWRLLLRILPKRTVFAEDTARANWRPDLTPARSDVTRGSPAERTELSQHAVNLSLSLSKGDASRSLALLDIVDSLPHDSVETFLQQLASDRTLENFSAEEESRIWESLLLIMKRHEKYPECDWTFESALISRIRAVADHFRPQTKSLQYRHLFTWSEPNLVPDELSFSERRKLLFEMRVTALEAIYLDGPQAILSFVGSLCREDDFDTYGLAALAQAAAHLHSPELDEELVGNWLHMDGTKEAQLARWYALCRHQDEQWCWTDEWLRKMTSPKRRVALLTALPYSPGLMERLEPPSLAELYWRNATVEYFKKGSDLRPAVEGLLSAGHALRAAQLLHPDDWVDYPVEFAHASLLRIADMIDFESGEVQKRLQELLRVLLVDRMRFSAEQQVTLEWAFLPIFDSHRGLQPKFLTQRLAAEPEFFVNAARQLHGDLADSTPTARRSALSRLLYQCSTAPGVSADGSFSEDSFNSWWSAVITALKSGYFEMEALAYPAKWCVRLIGINGSDPLPECVLDFLERRDDLETARVIRHSMFEAIYNMRRIDSPIDPAGSVYENLARVHCTVADSLQARNYFASAEIFRGVADMYSANQKRQVQFTRKLHAERD